MIIEDNQQVGSTVLSSFISDVLYTTTVDCSRERKTSTDVSIVKAAQALNHFNGTFDFYGEYMEGLYDNMYEAIAGEYIGKDRRIGEKRDIGKETCRELSLGFTLLKNRALEAKKEGRDAPYIYIVPADISGSQKKVCVTINPHHLPLAGTGKYTARELELGVESKLNTGQIRSSLRRMAAQYGQSEAESRLAANIISVMPKMIYTDRLASTQ